MIETYEWSEQESNTFKDAQELNTFCKIMLLAIFMPLCLYALCPMSNVYAHQIYNKFEYEFFIFLTLQCFVFGVENTRTTILCHTLFSGMCVNA